MKQVRLIRVKKNLKKGALQVKKKSSQGILFYKTVTLLKTKQENQYGIGQRKEKHMRL